MIRAGKELEMNVSLDSKSLATGMDLSKDNAVWIMENGRL